MANRNLPSNELTIARLLEYCDLLNRRISELEDVVHTQDKKTKKIFLPPNQNLLHK